jgi:hypothetical protein
MVVRDVRRKKIDYKFIFLDYFRSFIFLNIPQRSLYIFHILIPYSFLFVLSTVSICLRYTDILNRLVLVHFYIIGYLGIFSLFIFIFNNLYSFLYILYINILSFTYLPIYIYLYRYSYLKIILNSVFILFYFYFINKNLRLHDEILKILCVLSIFIFMHLCIN